VHLYRTFYQAPPPNASNTVGSWETPTVLFSRSDAMSHLNRYIKKLGNPVLYTDEGGRVWLFFVTVSFGGWAGSAINVTVSEDGGQHFGPVHRLTTSPFFNVSTLVRNRPVSLQDGGLLVPIYHEFIGKFCELLWLDTSGSIRDKQRLTWGRSTLQPALVPRSASEAAVFLRAASPRTAVNVMLTRDGGKTFSPPINTGLPNSNTAIDATLLPDGRWALVYNDDPIGRDALSIAAAQHAEGPWQTLRILAQQRPGSDEKRFAYPVIVSPPTPPVFHLMYTVERRYMRYETFNTSWLTPESGSATTSSQTAPRHEQHH
ncbi:MAG: exo-alpha-sialidase, partial [Gammaproteobacteria bacterium]